MPIHDIFSKRQKKLRGEMPDVYVYDELPEPLRVQIVHIWRDAFGDLLPNSHYGYLNIPQYVVDTLCREYGVLVLSNTGDYDRDYHNELVSFFLQEEDVEKALDAVELVFSSIKEYSVNYGDIIEELNNRFKEHGIGYQFINGQIIRIDSELIHSEIVKPALRLLDQQHYAGAQEEFLRSRLKTLGAILCAKRKA